MDWKKVAVVVSTCLSLPLAAYVALKLQQLSAVSAETEEDEVIERVLLFPDGGYQCNYWTAGDCRFPECRMLHHVTNKTRLKQVLQAAEKTIDVCMFVTSCAVLLDTLIEAHRRGILVRIVCDDMRISGSQFKIADAGLAVRVDNSQALMHHKFVVIDGRVLMSGSYNWTASGAAYNRENMFVTTERRVVAQFAAEMEKLWAMFEGSTEVQYEPLTSSSMLKNRFVHRVRETSRR